MFCKCFFAAVNRATSEASRPAVHLQPVFLPVKSFLVESEHGSGTVRHACESLRDRFVQARRHMQGCTEISYTMLQWVETIRRYGMSKVPFDVHIGTWKIVWSMLSVHNLPHVHLFAVILANWVCAKRLFGSNHVEKEHEGFHFHTPAEICSQVPDGSDYFHCMAFMSVPYAFVIPAALVIVGHFEVLRSFTCKAATSFAGRDGEAYGSDQQKMVGCFESSALLDDGQPPRLQAWHQEVGGTPSCACLRWRPIMFVQTALEAIILSWVVNIMFGFVPEVLAVLHLATVGVQFRYDTASKPVATKS